MRRERVGRVGWWAMVFLVAGAGAGCGDGGPDGYELLDASRQAAVETVDDLIEVVAPGRAVLTRRESDYGDCSSPFEQYGTRMDAGGVYASIEPFQTADEDRAALRRARRYLEDKGFEIRIGETIGGFETLDASSELVPNVTVDAFSQSRTPDLRIGAGTLCVVVK